MSRLTAALLFAEIPRSSERVVLDLSGHPPPGYTPTELVLKKMRDEAHSEALAEQSQK